MFTVIVVVIDISEKTDDFVKAKLPAWRIFTDYYLGFIPRIDAMLFPIFVFISVIFFTSKMAERSEIIAVLSSGVSFRRFLFPYWIGSFFLAAILWIGYYFVIPKANILWSDFQAKYIDINFYSSDQGSRMSNIYFRIDPTSYAGIRAYDTVGKRGDYFFIQKIADNKMVYNLRAQSITWDTAYKKWRLQNVMERTLRNDSEFIKRSDTLRMNYNFKPMDIRRDEYLKDRLSTPELNHFIETEKMKGSESIGSLMVERYNRDSIPASVIILSLIGAVLASRKVRGGSGFHIAIGFILSAIYILFSRLTVVFAMKSDFPPFLAAWTPNFIFIGIAYYLYTRAPK